MFFWEWFQYEIIIGHLDEGAWRVTQPNGGECVTEPFCSVSLQAPEQAPEHQATCCSFRRKLHIYVHLGHSSSPQWVRSSIFPDAAGPVRHWHITEATTQHQSHTFKPKFALGFNFHHLNQLPAGAQRVGLRPTWFWWVTEPDAHRDSSGSLFVDTLSPSAAAELTV